MTKVFSSILALRSHVSARIYPNGEAVIWRNKVSKTKPAPKQVESHSTAWRWACWQLYLQDKTAFKAASLHMGLSLLGNFDKMTESCLNKLPPAPKPLTRKGLRGITRSGARAVRNAAYLIQEEAGRAHLSFATVTVPPMPVDKLSVLHENWAKFVELYRLGLRRALEKEGLSGEIVTVTEVQEKRYENTGIPVLHLHSVFVGRHVCGSWVINPELHDNLVRNACVAVVGEITVSFKSAANLQRVHSSASGYLGKYLTKGGAVIKKLAESKFAGWLPRQWWNCTRSLKQRVDQNTIRADKLGDFMLSAAGCNDKNVWVFHGEVTLDIGEKEQYWLATYGRLASNFLADVKAFVRDGGLT